MIIPIKSLYDMFPYSVLRTIKSRAVGLECRAW